LLKKMTDTLAKNTDKTISEEQVLSADGTAIGYFKVGAGPSLVIVHGSLQSADDWLRAATGLAENFTCYVMDRRGRGRSGDSRDYSIIKEREDIEAVLNVAGEGAFLLGHSYGGVCALETANQFPVAKLVIYEPPIPVHKSVTSVGLDDYYDAFEKNDYEQALAIGLAQLLKMSDEELEGFKKSTSWARTVAHTPTWTREIGVIHHMEVGAARFATLLSPTLILVGANSLPYHLEDAETLNKVIPHSRKLCLKGQGHNAHATGTDYFVRVVTEFLLGDAIQAG
jgi:pimeloyl-ACP methyl ester carboxylesterase